MEQLLLFYVHIGREGQDFFQKVFWLKVKYLNLEIAFQVQIQVILTKVLTKCLIHIGTAHTINL